MRSSAFGLLSLAVCDDGFEFAGDAHLKICSPIVPQRAKRASQPNHKNSPFAGISPNRGDRCWIARLRGIQWSVGGFVGGRGDTSAPEAYDPTYACPGVGASNADERAGVGVGGAAVNA